METNGTSPVSQSPETSIKNPDTSLRNRILESSRQRFFAEGFSRISVDEISSSLGISKKTFYKVFSSKEDLLKQVIEQMLMDAKGRLEGIVNGEGDFVPKLKDLLGMIVRFNSTVSKEFLHDIQKFTPELWTYIENFRRERVLGVFGRLIDQGILEGDIRHDINRRILQLAHLNAIEQIVRPQVLVHESFSASEAVETISDIFLTGAMTEEGKRRFNAKGKMKK